MSRYVKKATSVLILIVFLFSVSIILPSPVYSETAGKTRVKAVLVLDSSGSMKKSDPHGLRYEAVKLFIDMCHNQGDIVGLTAYGDNIIMDSGLRVINSAQDKQNLKNTITSITFSDWTDTGLGLKKAVDLLNADSNPNCSPAIILLSDGKNDPSRPAQAADADIAYSIKAAKDKGYPIYTIGLNADNTVDKAQLSKFSTETGGESFITNKASDLPGILRNIFTNQFKLNSISGGDLKLTGKEQVVKFDVSDINTAEANIVFMAAIPLSVKLYDPNNTPVAVPSSNAILTKSNTYTLIKLLNPKQGKYTMKVTGQNGVIVNINYIFNYDLQLDVKYSKETDFKQGDTVKVNCWLSDSGQKIEDAEQYKLLNGKLIVKNLKDKSEKEVPLVNSGSDFSGECKLNDIGSYELNVKVDGKNFYRESSPLKVNIENKLPVLLSNKMSNLEIKAGKIKTLNLKSLFKDEDGDTLTFSADTNPSGVVNTTIENGVLKISALKQGVCLVSVIVADGKGGNTPCDFQVTVSETKKVDTSIILYSAAGAGIIILAAILIIVLKKHKNKPHEKKPKPEKSEVIRENKVTKVTAFSGQVMIEINDEALGSISYPQFKRLEDYKREISLHELLLEMPEFAETKKIKFKPERNRILVNNKSACLIEKNGVKPDQNVEFYIDGNDVLNVKLLAVKKSIKIQYLVK